MRKDDMVDEVLDAVMHHYKLKSTIEKKNIENYYKFNLADISFQKNKHPDLPNGVISDSALVKKNWEHRKEIINQHKEKYNKILSQQKELVTNNLGAKVAGYKYLHKKGFTPKIDDRPGRFTINCLARNFSHIRLGPRGRNFDKTRVDIIGPDASLNIGDNHFYFREDAVGSYWGNRLLNLDSHYFDRHNFYFSFTYDPYTSENGFISIKAQAHGNGGYSIYQECMPRGFYNRTSAVRMFASIDYAQPTPTGDMQFWEGEVKEIIGETISTNDTIGCDIPPSTGYLPEDITIDHGALRPIYNNRPFVITVRFQTYLVVDATGQGNIDVFMNVPMAWGEVYYR